MRSEVYVGPAHLAWSFHQSGARGMVDGRSRGVVSMSKAPRTVLKREGDSEVPAPSKVRDLSACMWWWWGM